MDIQLEEIIENKEVLFDLLDKVDVKITSQDKTKRREAYITELFFERKVLPQLTNSGAYSTGWCHYQIEKKPHWIKVILNPFTKSPSRNTDREFYKAVIKNNPKEKFFILGLNQDFQFTVWEMLKESGTTLLRVTDDCKHVEIDKMYSGLRYHLSRDKLQPSFCSTWLQKENNSSLFKLLTQRLLMNEGIPFPVDIDAIEYQEDSNKIIFHEFKRKDVCPNGSFYKEKVQLCPPWGIFKLRNKITDQLFSQSLIVKDNNQKASGNSGSIRLNNTTNQQIYSKIAELLGNEGYDLHRKYQCYGLDLSHALIVNYCEKNHFLYNHLIWDTLLYTGKKPAIPELFLIDGNLKEKAIISRSLLNQSSFYGITRTSGNDSGTFFSGVRLQLTIPLDLMNKDSITIDA